MCFPFPDLMLILARKPRFHAIALTVALLIPALAAARDLRVCADPDNLPFSNNKQQGFENRIAEVVVRDLNAHLVYEWQRMGRGFVREFINTGRCDLLIGVPSNFSPLLTTTPYYRSSFVFVTRRDRNANITSLDDPALRQMKIGVQVLDEDYTPPGTALARRGLQNQIVGFDVTGQPADSILRAVVDRRIDVAVVWGPLAGYFSDKVGAAIDLNPVMPEVDPPAVPFTFMTSMGVKKGNIALKDELEGVLQRHKVEIENILSRYRVPRLEMAPSAVSRL